MRLCCRLWAASVGSVLSLELCPLRLPPARLPPRPVASRPVASALTDGCDGRRTASRTAVPIFDIHLNPELPDHLAYQVDPRSPPRARTSPSCWPGSMGRGAALSVLSRSRYLLTPSWACQLDDGSIGQIDLTRCRKDGGGFAGEHPRRVRAVGWSPPRPKHLDRTASASADGGFTPGLLTAGPFPAGRRFKPGFAPAAGDRLARSARSRPLQPQRSLQRLPVLPAAGSVDSRGSRGMNQAGAGARCFTTTRTSSSVLRSASSASEGLARRSVAGRRTRSR